MTNRRSSHRLAADSHLPWQMFKTMQRHKVTTPEADQYDIIRELWSNGYFICTVYSDAVNHYLRLTVETADGKDMTWDQLMWVKQQVGQGNRWCIELYPDQREVVAIGANLRHLWICNDAPPEGWTTEREEQALRSDPDLLARRERILERWTKR